MTQEQADKIFETDLGQQLDKIYSTSDNRTFIRYEEAKLHTEGRLQPNGIPLEDETILEWYPGYEPMDFEVLSNS